ncbi:3-deoxy-7-phosphoheptulonate synthase [Streptomyces fuscigenes]|uniref:3-deoxy-7-phosphoheptulonate synthase n=1 Tax=Streptomyces fuscigenes TaxID=1528880 RepID=UPI001F45306B|nr:3-deoxy-7-phosphoheptulonate synthase class II [Streptomyces fuscigenes]MCF3963797.1 3-deoxy-7-phosphoheptulonate synthase [Streptomyces fuscigenes]
MTGPATSSLAADPPAAQQPDWPDRAALHAVAADLAARPALVSAAECDLLRSRLAEVACGAAVTLQGGDCAETFDGTTPERIESTYRTIRQMAAVVSGGAALPVVQLGRMAGQYAKPRSRPDETRDGVTLPAYRGDLVNGLEFTMSSRVPAPDRLRRGYERAAGTLEILRGLAAERGGAFFTAHEALVLEYERALTRDTPSGVYDLSAHLVWIGERTRQLDGAHLDFVAGVRNPVAVKLGPSSTPDDALALIDLLDPDREPGRLTFIARMGAGAVREVLPDLVAKVTASGARVVWVCDPMHGNTVTAPSGHKTRWLIDVLDEIKGFFEVHRSLGTHPGGVHLELSGEHVTECVGGTYEVLPAQVPDRYESACDPRLNRGQALDLAFELAELYAGRPTGGL